MRLYGYAEDSSRPNPERLVASITAWQISSLSSSRRVGRATENLTSFALGDNHNNHWGIFHLVSLKHAEDHYAL
jgi:hypothetical protein